MNRLRDKWDRDLTVQEKETERESVNVSDNSCGNPILNMLKYFSKNYDGNERTYIDKDEDKTNRSYRLFLVARNSSGFDSWVVLDSSG